MEQIVVASAGQLLTSIKVLRVQSFATVLEPFGEGRGLALEGKDSALLLTFVIQQILR